MRPRFPLSPEAGPHPHGPGGEPDGRALYVANAGAGSVSVIHTDTGTVTGAFHARR
ncbi:hypothetical protein [Streptomyces virginiae]|uniref:hypothetical protein n=1 Tax=Streptomyces virginiae TaxID=1961 RepID=UPI003417ED6E